MASIARRPDGRWRPRYRDEAGKEHARHFERKVDAQRWLDDQTAHIAHGTYVDPSAGRITFAWLSDALGRRNSGMLAGFGGAVAIASGIRTAGGAPGSELSGFYAD